MLNCMQFIFSGRSLSNIVINLGIRDQFADALSQLGFDFEVLAEQVNLTFDFLYSFIVLILDYYY